MTWTRPVLMGKARETLSTISAAGEPIVPENMGALQAQVERTLFLPTEVVPDDIDVIGPVDIIPDGNRGAFVPDLEVEWDGRRWSVGLKGIGARHPMFGQGHLGTSRRARPEGRAFSSEAWFGENPWGAMSEQGCHEDAEITGLMGEDGSIAGFRICPMLRAEPLPDWLMEGARDQYWYRRLDRPGPYYQQLRIMPSDVRLFYASEFTLGTRVREVLEAFRVDTTEALDAFVDNYIGSGMAALTLAARTAGPSQEWGHRALDYDDVWLDKDSVLAPDGTLYFADIEGVWWVPLRDQREASHRMKRQFNRNLYEFMYGLDCLLDERDAMTGREATRDARRRELALRMDLALAGDRHLDIEEREGRVDLRVTPDAEGISQITIKIMDMDGGRK